MNERELRKLVMETIGREHCLDDCAVLTIGTTNIVASTDMVHESTDFPPGMTDYQIGWMSIAVTLSDIAAMGAKPSIVMLAVGLDRGSRLKAILQGAADCCRTYGAILAGGDLDAHDELTIVSSGIGFADRPVRRYGSEPGDRLCITGVPGRSQAALEGYHQYDDYLLKPRPQVTEGIYLAKSGVNSMMDNSDGLVISLYDMIEANPGCGYCVNSDALPALEGVPGDKSREFSLYGGGDFGLIFTCKPELELGNDIGYHVIGTVTKDAGVLIDGRAVEIQGYQHIWEK